MDNVLVYFHVIINPGREDEDVLETVSSGKMYLKGENIYVVYSEMDEVFMQEFTGVIKIEAEKISVIRYNRRKEPYGKMEFEAGRRRGGYFGMEQGYMDIETDTAMVTSNVSFETGGTLSVDYCIEVMGVARTRHLLSIEIKKENSNEEPEIH